MDAINDKIKKLASGTQGYKDFAILIIICGFIGGIVLGNVFPVVETTTSGYYYKTTDTTESFNTALMIATWVSTILTSLIPLGIHSICYRLDLLIEKK